MIDLQNKQLGPEALDTFVSINNLGLAYYNCGDYENAEPLFLEALAGYKKILEPSDENIRVTTNNLALTYTALGNNEKTIEYYKILIDLEEEQLGPIAHNTLLSKNNLGLTFFNLGNYVQAKILFEQAAEGLKDTLGSDHPDTVQVFENKVAAEKEINF